MAKEIKDVNVVEELVPATENEIPATDLNDEINVPVSSSDVSPFDDFENVNPFEVENENTFFREGVETVFDNTGVRIYQNIRPDATGYEWINCKSIVKKVIREDEPPFLHEVNFVPGTERGRNKKYMNELCKQVFGKDKGIPLQIVKTVTTNNNVTTTRYTARICYKNPEGLETTCPMSPAGEGGRAAFNNVIAILKHFGRIN